MKKLLFGLFTVLLFSCTNTTEDANSITINYHVIMIEECQYIVRKAPSGDYGWIMSHKGNCNNPIHKCK